MIVATAVISTGRTRNPAPCNMAAETAFSRASSPSGKPRFNNANQA